MEQRTQVTPSPDKSRFDEGSLGESHAQGSDEYQKSPGPFSDIVLFRSVINDLPFLFISLVVIGMAGWFTISLRGFLDAFLGKEAVLSLPAVLIACVSVILIVIAFRRFNARYLIAGDGVKALRGIISNAQVDAKLEYYQIRGTEIRRSLFERLVGTGDLHVRGSTSTDTEVTFKGIYDPYRYQKIIQERHRLEVGGLKDLD